jgi:hypothetical protein
MYKSCGQLLIQVEFIDSPDGCAVLPHQDENKHVPIIPKITIPGPL